MAFIFTGDTSGVYNGVVGNWKGGLEPSADDASEGVIIETGCANAVTHGITGTDSSDNTQGTDFNTAEEILITGFATSYTNSTGLVGDIIRIESEVMRIIKISGNDYTFERGAGGTTAATHATPGDIYIFPLFTLASWLVEPGMAKAMGTYDLPLHLDAVKVTLSGTAEQHLYFNDATAIEVLQSARTGTNTGYGLNLYGGNVGANDLITIRAGANDKIALGPQGQTGAFTAVLLKSGIVLLGTGLATVTTFTATGGKFDNRATVTTATISGSASGEWTTAGTCVTMTGKGDSVININSTGTITNLVRKDGCIFNFEGGGTQGIIVTNATIHGETIPFIDPNKRVTWTNGIIDNDGAYGLGPGRTIDIS